MTTPTRLVIMTTDVEKIKAYNLVWNEFSHALAKLNKDGHSDSFVISVMAGMAAAAAVHMGCSRETFVKNITKMFDSAKDDMAGEDATAPRENPWRQ